VLQTRVTLGFAINFLPPTRLARTNLSARRIGVGVPSKRPPAKPRSEKDRPREAHFIAQLSMASLEPRSSTSPRARTHAPGSSC
jgi:hypothetical protein